MRSFTLIETIVAVMIFFVLFLALLHNSATAKRLEQLALEQNDFAYKSTIAFIERPTSSNLYEALQEFNITQDRIIERLKNEKIFYEEKIDSSEDINLSESISFQKIIQKLIAYDQEHRATIYSIKILR